MSHDLDPTERAAEVERLEAIDAATRAWEQHGVVPAASILAAAPALARRVTDKAVASGRREYAASRVAPAVESTRAPRASQVETR